MKRSALAMLVLGGVLMAASSAQAAAAGSAATRTARVAGGGKVSLVDSARTPAQWSAERPKVRSLRPKVRGNVG